MNSFPNTLLGRWAERWRAARERVRAERAIARLSPALRKDIGWPAAGSNAGGWHGHLIDGK